MAEKKKTIAEKIEERVQAWLDSANSFSEGAKAQYSTEGYRGNTKEYYDSVTASVAASKKEAETIRKMLQGYGSYVGDDYVKNVTKYLDDFGGYENQILAAAKQDYEYFSRFADENAYLSALESERKEEAKKTVDWESLLSEVEKDQTYIDAAKEFKSHYEAMIGGLQTLINYYESLGYSKSQARVMAVSPDQDPVRNKMLGYLNTYGESKLLEDTTSLQDDVNTRRAYANSAKYIQLAPNMEANAKSDPSFEEYANDRPDMFEILKEGRYQGFTEDQIKVWNYYYNTDPKLAEEYRYAIEESVNQKIGEKRFKELEDQRFLEYLFAIEAGLDQFTTGFESLFSGADYIPASSTAFASSLVREDLKDAGATLPEWLGGGSVGQGAYDLITTTANMVPSILASFIPYVGQAASLTMLGASAAGHARAEAINLGYTNEEATTFGLLVGASEASLQYLLGGIGKMGGVSKNAVLNALGGVEKGFLKVASKIANSPIGKWVASMASEGLEEYLQTIIEPQIRNAILKENNEINLIDPEALYSGILGALSAGFLESGGLVGGTVDSISAAIDTRAIGKAVIDSGMTANIQEFVYNTFAADTVAYKIANKITDKTGAYKIGRLLNSVQANLSEQNKSDIQAALIQKGVAEKDAKTITDALANVIGVKKLSEAEEALYEQGLESNDVIATVLREVIIDPNSSVNQRTSQFNTLTDDIQAAYLGNIVRSAGMQGISEEDAVNLKKEAEFYSIGADEFLASAQASNATPAHFSRAFKERYLQGKIGDKTVSKYVNSYLSETEQNTAYRLGEIAAKAERESAQKTENAMPKKKVERGTGRVTVDSSVSAASREGAKTQIQAVEKIAEALGIRVRFYESVVSKNGNLVLSTNKNTAAPNGWFDKDTNTIHLDIKAGKDGKGFVMFTLAHELTHFIAKWSKTQFNVLADFVTERYNKEGKDITRTIRNRMKNLAEQNIKSYMALTTEEARYEYAREEVIADSMETMLASGNVMRDLADLRTQSEELFNKIRGFLKDFANKIRKLYQKIAPETAEGKFIAASKDAVEELEKLFANALKVSAENYAAADKAVERATDMSNEEAFRDSSAAIMCQIRPPFSTTSKAFSIFVDELNEEARSTFDTFYNFYEASRLHNVLNHNGKRVKSINISSVFLTAQQWNAVLRTNEAWRECAKQLAAILPDDIRKNMRMNTNGTLVPSPLEDEFKMAKSLAQRLVDALPYEAIDSDYEIDGKIIKLPTGKSSQSVGGEAYRRAILKATRDLYKSGEIKKVSIGAMTKDIWGSLGFLATNGKTGASGDLTTLCPQMMYNRGCYYCYRRAAMESGVNNKLVGEKVWYTGEILRIKDADITRLNKNGGLRIQSFGDWSPQFSAQLADILYDAELRGLQIKIITKEPGMIEYVAALKEQGIGNNLYFNLSTDYAIEKAPKADPLNTNSLSITNPARPHMRTSEGMWWKRAMTVEEANVFRKKYSWVNTRIVATTQEEFIRGLKDRRVDVVTGYHGHVRTWERIDSSTGEKIVNVEALGDAGMPRFKPNTDGTWTLEYEGKTKTQKELAARIAKEGLEFEYYSKTCCITGRCATCEGKCGQIARSFAVKNATNRDTDSITYWQENMFNAMGETDENGFVDLSSSIIAAVDSQVLEFREENKLKTTPFFEDLRRKVSTTPSDENFSPSDSSVYQLRETREYTDRELLADALDSVATSEEDRKKLAQYKKKVADADELERTLSELRAKKKALEEAKAKRSEIRAVQDEITKTENRITIIDKQLFNLQATVSMKRVLESEKKRRAKQARAKQKASDDAKRKKAVSDAVKEAEDDYQKKLDAQKKHQAEIEARRKERASRTELRHKIIDKVKKLSDKLRNPSKDKHIPASLQKPVARFLSAISIDTFGADKMINRNLKKLEALLDKLEKATNDIDRSVLMDKIAELQNSIQWEEAIGVSIKEKASTMRSAYEALANDKDPRVQDGYDQVVADMLKEVVEVCGDTPLRYMTLEQLTTLNDAINAVNKRVSESNKAFSEGKKKTIEEYAEATARELPDTSKASVVKFVKAIKRFGWGLLKPATAMEIIGSQTFTELYENIQDGEETWMQNIAKAKAFFQESATKHGYYSWDLQKTYDFVDTRGKTFTLTLGEMLSLYAYSRRPQAAKHLEEGGFKFDEKSDDRRKKKNRKNDKENHKLNRDILKVIENKIGETEGALEFANELQAYLSKDMAALGNEISMRMYDYLAFGEENYFPIYSSKSYIDFNPDSQGNILLKNRSFTKSVAKGANNPIIVGDFVDIWTRHVNEMITYNAFALPVEDFMRTYNFKFKTEDGSQDSIKDRIVKAYGEDAAKYVEQLLRDINGGVVADHSAEFADALVTRFKKLKVMLSASVVIQQPSAMARAFAMIDPKYFRGIGVGNHQERWERVMKYAPIAMIKAMGRFDINLGQSAQDYLTAQEYSGTKEKAKAVFTDKNYRDEVLTRAPAYADEIAWITIFEACEREMAELRPDLEKGSEKFMQLVGRRFTEVIRATQVYDSVFSRSQIMRSKNVFTKMITAFMSEPTTTLNMAFRSMLEASRSGKKWYALPFNRTMAAVSTSIILNSLLVSIVYAMRDDDEDETYLESYLESFTTEVADGFNPLTYIPFVKDIWSLLQGYDVERTDMALWSDIIDKAYDFIKVFSTDTSEMSEEAYDKWLKDVWSQSASAVSEILSFATGIPITNVIRDASGAVDTTVDALTSDRENSWDTMFDAIAEGFKNTLPGSNLKPNNPAKYDPTYSDYTSYKPKDAFAQFDRGNTAKGKEIIDKLIKARIKAGDTEKEAKASLRSSFTSTYKDAYKKAYLAGDNAECVRIRKILKESGVYANYIETYIEWNREAMKEKNQK